MRFFLAMIYISVGFSVESMAQSIIISKDGINQEADTLNFGARTENNPKVDSFLVVNNTKDTLFIPYDPLYLNRVNAIPFDNSFAEFELDTNQQRTRPFIIVPQSTFAIKVNFKVDTADKGAGFEADQSVKKGRIFIHLCKIQDTSTIVASDTMYLFGDRTIKYMKPSDSVIVFDTMYIGATKRDTLIVYNGTDSKTLNLEIKQNIMSNVNIPPSDIGLFTLLPNEKREIPIEYTVRTLADSLLTNVLTITSNPGSISQNEVSNINLKTFVAFQKFEIDSSATALVNLDSNVRIPNRHNVILSDTIATGSFSKRYEIALRNNGNIQLNIDSVIVSGDTNGFLFDFSLLKKDILPTRPTSFIVTFNPKKQPGNWSTSLSFYTDLRRRFPDQQLQSSLEIIPVTINGIAKAARPELISLPDTCSLVYVSQKASVECNPGCNRTFIIKNNGDAELKVDSIFFAKNSPEFITDNRKSIVKPGETDTIRVLLKPGIQVGSFTNTLMVFTNTGSFTNDISFTSVSTSAIITIDTIEASPGEVISIPINVQSDQLIRAQYFLADFIIPYESRSALEFIEFNLNNSAAEKATPTRKDTLVQPIDGGPNNQLLSFGLNQTGSFEQFNSSKKSLGELRFKYFLNERNVNEIRIGSYKLGYGYVVPDREPVFCDDFFNITYPSKIIIKAKDNSFCADQETLESFFADIRSKKISFTAMMPMSGESVVEIQHFIPESFHTDISLYAVTGEKVATIFSGIAPTELTKIQHPLTNLPKGVYYCELRTGAFRKTIPIVITQ
ncbi:MAG: hypothetical protein ACO3GR_03900 [Candidatus Kapaibacteriota bacterium]